MLHFTLLGALGVARDGIASKLALPRKGASLLAYVLLNGTARLQRERVAAIVWPDEPESDGRAKLRRMLYVIGQAAPEAGSAGWIASDTLAFGWNPAVHRTLDVELLREALASPEPAGIAGMYTGDLLADFDDEWLQSERDRLREGAVRGLERLAQAGVVAGRYADARAAALDLLRLEPWREDAMRMSIEMRFANGDRAGALSEYDRFAARLRQDLGVDPMPETAALRSRLLASTPAPPQSGPSPAAEMPPVPGPSGAHFVGRERELAMLTERFGEAERGRGGLVLIGGEAGIGKTELVARVARRVADRGGLVLTAGATFVATRPYQPFAVTLGLAHRTMPESALTEQMRTAIDRLVLDADVARDASSTDEIESAAARRRLFESVVATFEAAAAHRPLLLVLEDVHWAGTDTIALLEYFARRVRSSRILAIATYRDGEILRSHPLRATRRRLREDGLVATVALGGLHEDDVRRYLEAVQGGTTPETVRRCYEASRGLPLVLAGLAADASAGSRDAPSVVPVDGSSEKMAALAERLASLPPEVRSLLEIAAVSGFGFATGLLVELSGWSEAEVNRALGVAIGCRILRETANGYDFAHDLFREIVYEAMPPNERALRHVLVAEALETEIDGGHAVSAELAMHYERGGDRARAIPNLMRAAVRASAALAHEDAAGYVTRALELGASGRTAIELLLIRERSLGTVGDRARQRADLEVCTRWLLAGPDPELEAEVLERLVRLELVLSRFESDLQRLPEARGDARRLFDAEIALAVSARMESNHPETNAHLQRAEAQLPALGNEPSLMALLYEQRQRNANNVQRYAEAADWAERRLEAAEQSGDVFAIGSAAMDRGQCATRLHDFARADRCLKRSAELFESMGAINALAVARLYRSMLDERLGYGRRAIEDATRSLETFREQNMPYDSAEALTLLARYELSSGAFEPAEVCAREALELATQLGYAPIRGLALTSRSVALCALGSAAEASPLVREACAIAERTLRPRDAAEAWTAAALAAAHVGNDADLRTGAERARALLSELSDSNRPAGLYVQLAAAFRLADDERNVRDTIREGARILQIQASAIESEVWRSSFLARDEYRPLLVDVGAGRKPLKASYS